MERARNGGFTLVETVAALAIVSIAAAGIFSALSFALAHQADGMQQAKVAFLAESYVDQILARRYDELTPPGGVPPCQICSAQSHFDDGESRAGFDDVDDFDGLLDAPPRDENGDALPGLEGYSVAVSVRYADAVQQAALGVQGSGVGSAKIVTVVVTTPNGKQQQFVVVRANF